MKRWIDIGIGFLFAIVVLSCIAMYARSSMTTALAWVQLLSPIVSIVLTLFIVILAYATIRNQTKLHREIYRPVMVCDFVIVYQAMYFRIKNFGTSPAINIVIQLTGGSICETLLSKLPPSIPLLSPNAELLYIVGPPYIPEDNISVTVKYSSSDGRSFQNKYPHSMKIFKGVDIGHDNNSPIVKKLEDIAKALQK